MEAKIVSVDQFITQLEEANSRALRLDRHMTRLEMVVSQNDENWELYWTQNLIDMPIGDFNRLCIAMCTRGPDSGAAWKQLMAQDNRS